GGAGTPSIRGAYRLSGSTIEGALANADGTWASAKEKGGRPPRVTITRGPYLQSTQARSTIVVWRTAKPTESVVEVVTGGVTRTAGDPRASETSHAVTLALEPGASTYRILVGGAPISAPTTFNSAPESGSFT